VQRIIKKLDSICYFPKGIELVDDNLHPEYRFRKKSATRDRLLSLLTLTFDLKFELGRDFCTLHLTANFHHPTFNHLEVIVLTNKQKAVNMYVAVVVSKPISLLFKKINELDFFV